MILQFNERFREPILSGKKVTSFRRDEEKRWTESGVPLECMIGDELITEQVVSDICFVKLYISSDDKSYSVYRNRGGWIDEDYFAENEGFGSRAEVWDFFAAQYPESLRGVPLYGKIICWADMKY